jgi:hypothetical protein
MTAFPTMVETARKSSREARMFDFRLLVLDDRAAQLADFIERYYSDNKVVVLKMAKAVLLTTVLCATAFLGIGYYISSSVIPEVKSNAKQLGLTEDMLGHFERSLLELPNICFFVSCLLIVLVFLIFLLIGFYFDLPHDLMKVINPTAQVAYANEPKKQAPDTNKSLN